MVGKVTFFGDFGGNFQVVLCVSLAQFKVSCMDKHALLDIFLLHQLNIIDILWREQ